MVPPPRRCSPRGIHKVRVAVVRLAFSLWQGSTNGRGNNVACSLTQMVQHGPTCTHPVQESLTAETEEGFASYRRPQAQRLGSWCTICIPTVGTGLVTQTKKKELVSEQRPQAQRLGSWCTVASLQLANVSSRRRRKGSPRIDAQSPYAWEPGVQAIPSSWHVSHPADRGRACLVSTPTHTKRWKLY